MPGSVDDGETNKHAGAQHEIKAGANAHKLEDFDD